VGSGDALPFFLNMITNKDFTNRLTSRLRLAVLLVELNSNLDIKLASGLKGNKDKLKNLDGVYIGLNNALSNGRSDFFSAKIKRAISRTMLCTSFPKEIVLKECVLGLKLITKKEKNNGNNDK